MNTFVPRRHFQVIQSFHYRGVVVPKWGPVFRAWCPLRVKGHTESYHADHIGEASPGLGSPWSRAASVGSDPSYTAGFSELGPDQESGEPPTAVIRGSQRLYLLLSAGPRPR